MTEVGVGSQGDGRLDLGRTPSLLLLLLSMVVASAVRLQTWSACFQPNRVLFFGADPYDHVRRVFQILSDFPHVPRYDFYFGYPEGAFNFWPPLYHLCIAGASLLVGGTQPDPRTVETVGAVSSVVVGVLSLIPVYLIGCHLGGRFAGQVAAWSLAILPAHIGRTLVGRPDNNALEPLLAGLLFWAVSRLFLKGDSEARREGVKEDLSAALLISAAAWIALFSWRGSGLLLAIVASFGALLLVIRLLQGNRDLRVVRVIGVALLVFSVATGPMVFLGVWGARQTFEFGVISWFHVFVFGFVGALLAVVSGRQLSRVPASLLFWMAAGCALAGSLIVGAWFFKPGIFGEAGLDLHRLLASRGARWGIAEFEGLIDPGSPFQRPIQLLTWAGLLAPLIWMAAVFNQWKNSRFERSCALFFLYWSLCFGVLVMVRLRFAALASLAVAILLALFAERLLAVLRARFSQGGDHWKVGLALLTTSLLLVPSFQFVTDLRGGSYKLPITDSLFGALEWIRTNTPPTSHYDRPTQRPEYGVMGQWDFGSWIVYLARRPAIATPWGDEIHGLEPQAAFFLAEDVAAAEGVLVSNGARYVIITNVLRYLGDFSKMLGIESEPYLESAIGPDGEVSDVPTSRWGDLVSTRLLLTDGGPLGPGDPRTSHPGCLRLVYESPGRLDIRGGWGPVSQVKIFEAVKGALLEGVAEPGAVTTLSLDLVANTGRRFVWRSVSRASDRGTYSFRMPYSTRGSHSAVRSVGSYSLRLGAAEAVSVDVTDPEILKGAVIPVNNGGESVAGT